MKTVDHQRCNLLLDGFDISSEAVIAQHLIPELEKIEGIALVKDGEVSGGIDQEQPMRLRPFSDPPAVPEKMRVDCVLRHWAAGAKPLLHDRKTLAFMPCTGRDATDIVLTRDEVDRLLQGDDRIITASFWSRDRLIESGIAGDAIAIVPYGIDPLLFRPLSVAERANTRRALGVDDGEAVLLNISDGSLDAGLDLLIRAYARLRSRGDKVRLVLKHEDLRVDADYGAILAQAVAYEPSLPWTEILSTIIVIPAGLARSDLRLLYGAADCYVSSYRDTPFNLQVLEAIGTGTPVIVTDGGATDDFCDHDVAWRISSVHRQFDNAGTGRSVRWLEPDLDELTEALSAVARGAGFDRTRFARARARIVAGFSWVRAAHEIAALATGCSTASPSSNPTHFGLARSADPRFAAALHIGLPEKRREAMDRSRCPDGHSLSIVVQGPCFRAGNSTAAPAIEETLASIRRTFPRAQIVYSTWLGSDVEGLDADDIVLSSDPGPLEDGVNKTNNVNRVVTSTSNGLAAATRPFCIKTRNDILFSSDRLASKDLRVAADALSLKRRIWVEANRLETSLRAFHPSDIIQFGMTDDLRRLWDVPPVTWEQSFLPEPTPNIMRAACEQSIFIGYLRGIGIDVSLENTFDVRYQTVAASVEFMLGAFDIFNPEDEGVLLPLKFRESRLRPALMETTATFETLRDDFSRDRHAACLRIYSEMQNTINSVRNGSDA